MNNVLSDISYLLLSRTSRTSRTSRFGINKDLEELKELWKENNPEAYKFINDNGIDIEYNMVRSNRTVTLTKNNEEIGWFYINGDLNTLLDMSIFLEDEFHGKKIAKLMVGFLIINMINKEPKIRKDQLIFIDTDASGFYWDSLGMKISRHSDRTHRDVVGEGYEKNITFSDLSKKVLGICYGE